MKRAIVSVLLASLVWLGAKAAFASVTLDCFSFQSDNKSIFVPATGTVDVFVSGNGGAWVEIVPANPTDHFHPIISDTAGHVLDNHSGANGYARAYLRTGSGTVRISTSGGVGFSAVAACKNTFPRNN
jgi:hypothetical protein